jgi:predicted hydrocarbon binding protein
MESIGRDGTMAKIKGSSVSSVFAFMEEKLGSEALDGLLARQTASDRGELARPAFAFKWYPLDTYMRFLDLAGRDAFAQNADAGRQMGAKIVRDGLNGVYRVLLGILSQSYIINQSPELWKRYFDGEDLSLSEVKERSLAAEVRGAIVPCPLYCRTILGGIEETVRLAGGKNVVGEEVSCRAAGRDRCTFEVRWS